MACSQHFAQVTDQSEPGNVGQALTPYCCRTPKDTALLVSIIAKQAAPNLLSAFLAWLQPNNTGTKRLG